MYININHTCSTGIIKKNIFISCHDNTYMMGWTILIFDIYLRSYKHALCIVFGHLNERRPKDMLFSAVTTNMELRFKIDFNE